MDERKIAVRGGAFETDVLEGGSGDPLLYLHGVSGLDWGDLLERLSANHRVIAPRHPGFGGSTGTDELADVPDLIYYYLDLLDELELDGLPIVGHSLGGMIAAELAAVQPQRFTRLTLISSYGLWDASAPGADLFATPGPAIISVLYADTESAVAQAAAAAVSVGAPAGGDGAMPDEMIETVIDRQKGMQTSAKYLWPIPNRGLDKRLHRVRQPTLLVWGADDKLAPVAWGEALRARLANARLEVIDDAGHMVVAEQPERVAELIEAFLD